MKPQIYEKRMPAKDDGISDCHEMYSADTAVIDEIDAIAIRVPIDQHNSYFRFASSLAAAGYFHMLDEGNLVGVLVTIYHQNSGVADKEQDVRIRVQTPNTTLPAALEKIITKYEFQ